MTLSPRGFTLLELLTVIAIIVVIAGGVSFSFSSYFRHAQLDITKELVGESLRLARSKAAARLYDQPWGVYVDTAQSRFILFGGRTYETRLQEYDMPLQLHTSLLIKQVSFNDSGNQLIFQKTTGHTYQYGEIELQEKNSSRSAKIYINTLGQIYVE